MSNNDNLYLIAKRIRGAGTVMIGLGVILGFGLLALLLIAGAT